MKRLLLAILLISVAAEGAEIRYPAGTGGPGGGYSTIQDETVDLTQRSTVNFTGAGVACVDNAGATRTDCTIAGGGGGAPTTATYITQTPDGTLSAEQALSALGTGLVKNTTTTGVLSIYAGTSCTNQFPRSLDASGAATCASVSLTADITGTLAAGNGGSGVTTVTDDTVLVANGSAWEAKALPSCSDATTSKLLYNSTTNAFSCGTDQGAAGGTTINIVEVSGSDSSTTSTNLGDITGLTWSITANTTYYYECNLQYTTSASTADFLLAFNGPATLQAPSFASITLIGSASVQAFGVVSAYDTAITLGTTGAATVQYAWAKGRFKANNNGTFALRFATSTGTPTLTVKIGSYCEWHT